MGGGGTRTELHKVGFVEYHAFRENREDFYGA